MRRRLLSVSVLALLLCLPSCFTPAVWSKRHPHGWDLAGRVVLTPFAAVLDAVLFVGLVALAAEDDCGSCHFEYRAHSCHR